MIFWDSLHKEEHTHTHTHWYSAQVAKTKQKLIIVTIIKAEAVVIANINLMFTMLWASCKTLYLYCPTSPYHNSKVK